MLTNKVVLITGAAHRIGATTARMLHAEGMNILLHYRHSREAAEALQAELNNIRPDSVSLLQADLHDTPGLPDLIENAIKVWGQLDVLINNAGILRTSDPITEEGLDVRFAVNTIAPYLITKRLLPLMGASGRIINLSSAAQSPVNLDALTGRVSLSDELEAYAQSKLAITAWSRVMALSSKGDSPAIIAVNPGSLLGTKMVKEGFGMAGSDIRIGAEILIRAALSDEFATASGKYFDNDSGQFSSPHPDAMDAEMSAAIMLAIEAVLAETLEPNKKLP